MKEPTGAEVKEFWEECGFIKNTSPPLGYWSNRKDYYAKDLPSIDLNNLFKYEPITAQGYHIETNTYKREVAGDMGQCSWVTITKDEKFVVCFAGKELRLVLFWALDKVMKGEIAE